MAQAAGLPICLHGQFVSGLTDLFHHQLVLTIPNLTDGNQIMHQLLKENILAAPSIEPEGGQLGIFDQPGIGLDLDQDAAARANEEYGRRVGAKIKSVEFVYSYD